MNLLRPTTREARTSLATLPQITAANAALMERTTFAIDDAKDEDDTEEDETFGIGGDDDEVMDEVDAFLEAHDSGLTAADQELAKGALRITLTDLSAKEVHCRSCKSASYEIMPSKFATLISLFSSCSSKGRFIQPLPDRVCL